MTACPVTPFDLVVGIDWSGARQAKGVALAAADPAGVARPLLPPSGGWTRQAAVDWLADAIAGGRRMLIGIDCSLSLPWVEGEGYLGGRLPEAADLYALWDAVEAASGGAPDLFGGQIVADPRFAPSFWTAGPRPAWWGEGQHRRSERAVAAAGLGRPASVFNLAAASMQVGKASLAGMRAMRALRGRAQGRLAVWPADGFGLQQDGRSVLVEAWPTLFRRLGGHGNAKITGRTALEAALTRFGCRAEGVPERFDDHLGDAMVTACGLLHLAERADLWQPAGLSAAMARREAWIFGVGC